MASEELDLFILVATPDLHDPFGFFDRNVILVQKLANGLHRGSTINRARVERTDIHPCGSILYAGPQSPKEAKCLLSVVDGKVYYDWDDEESTRPSAEDKFDKERGDVLFFCFGDSGWETGQLENELERGSWYKLPLDSDVINDKDWETMWERLVCHKGGNPDDYVAAESSSCILVIDTSNPDISKN